jgi:hypothetical protein
MGFRFNPHSAWPALAFFCPPQTPQMRPGGERKTESFMGTVASREPFSIVAAALPRRFLNPTSAAYAGRCQGRIRLRGLRSVPRVANGSLQALYMMRCFS